MKTKLEQFVEAYVRQKKFSFTPGDTIFLRKARTLINKKLNVDCCVVGTSPYTHTNEDNILTSSVAGLIKLVDRVVDADSITRTVALLDKHLVGCCSGSIQGTISIPVGAGAGTITGITLVSPTGAITHVSGDTLPLAAGDSGQFKIPAGVYTLTVIGTGVETGLNWRVIDSTSESQEAAYVATVGVTFNEVVISNVTPWTISLVLA